MKRIIFLTIPMLLITGIVSSQPADKQQFASIGNLPLENGHQIIDCKIGYRTFGKLNAQRSNTVIYPTGWGGTTAMVQMFGVGQDIDTTKFYLILIDALGNGVSSSPSNSIKQPKTLFPLFNIRDLVNSQYKMLTQQLNIHHLAAVVGGSMGGLQALQWAVSYPEFMDKVVAIEASPKLTSYDLLWMNTYIDAVKSDTTYQGGNYSKNPNLVLASRVTLLISTTPANLNTAVPVDSFYLWLSSNEKSTPDCNDWVWQLQACMQHDIGAKVGGSLEKAAGSIKAKVLIIANKQDLTVNQTPAIKFASMIKAKLIIMDTELGHLIFSDKIPIQATRKFLLQ